MGGLTHEQVNVDKRLSASGRAEVRVEDSTWIALRVRGSYKGQHGEIAAHTSAVQVVVEGRPIFHRRMRRRFWNKIEGAIAYLDTLAPRPEARRLNRCAPRWRPRTIACTSRCTSTVFITIIRPCTITGMSIRKVFTMNEQFSFRPVRRPNVIWIFGDQHRAHALSYRGDPNVFTPNIDNLAREGMRFDCAVSGAPWCSPFRGALMTGTYPHQMG